MYSNTGLDSNRELPEDDIIVSNSSDDPIPYVQAVILPDDNAQQVVRLQDQWEARVLAEQPEVVVDAVQITADNADSNPHIKNTAQPSTISLLLRRKSFLVFLLCCIGATVTAIVCATRRDSDTNSAKKRLAYLLETLGPYIVRDRSEYQDLVLLEVPTSPQAQALSWMAELDEYSDQPEHVETKNLLERYVLAVLYFSTSGSNWTNTFPFMDGVSDVCRWNTRDPSGNGIFCMDSINYGAITGVALQGLELKGTIPWELSLLTDATWLRLSGNSLTGNIPEELSALTGLSQLSLHSNSLSGTMISSISLPSVLVELDLGSNILSGTLPIGWLRTMTNLTNLQLGGNRLRGTLPSQLASLTLLTTLQLNENRFRGTIPTQWNSLSQLTYLGLGGNRLSGTIPQASGSFSSVLEELHLEGNFFTGTLPSEWPGVMTSLTHLGLGRNNLQGQLPSTWEDFEHLLHLDLGKNALIGRIPSILGGMSSLRNLSLKENAFTGAVPFELAILPNISVLDISGNFNLSGTLPQEFSNWDTSKTLLVNATNFTESVESLFCSNNSTLPTLYADCLVEAEDTLCSCCTYCCSPDLPFYCESNDGNPVSGERAHHANFLALMGPHIIQNDDDQYLSHGPSSPQYQALSWMMNVDNFSFNFEELLIETLLERYALAVMYFAMSGWPEDLQFLDETLSVCEWIIPAEYNIGVICKDGDEVVQQINLDVGLSGGTIPWNELSLLKELTLLDLSYNSLTGTLPPRMNDLSKLAKIYLGENLLTGTLPANLSEYPKSLQILDVSHNQLEGTIPTTIGSMRLTSLYLNDNELAGPLPTELGELTRLSWLHIDTNRLSGTLPSELGNLTNLYKLWLSSNRFTGTVPEEYSNLFHLSEVFMWDTSLTGSVDTIFCDWRNPPPLMGADCAGNDPELECSCCSQCHW